MVDQVALLPFEAVFGLPDFFSFFLAGFAVLGCAGLGYKLRYPVEKVKVTVSSVVSEKKIVKKAPVSSGAMGFQVFGAGSKLMTAVGDVTVYSQDFVVYPKGGKSLAPEEATEEKEEEESIFGEPIN